MSSEIWCACSALSALPSIMSLAKSSPSGGLSWLKSLMAASATAPSSVPWMRWMFDLSDMVRYFVITDSLNGF